MPDFQNFPGGRTLKLIREYVFIPFFALSERSVNHVIAPFITINKDLIKYINILFSNELQKFALNINLRL